MSASTSSRCCWPASLRVAASSTDTLAGTRGMWRGPGMKRIEEECGRDFARLPAPYAGTNRIRFNGFAGEYRRLRSCGTTPRFVCAYVNTASPRCALLHVKGLEFSYDKKDPGSPGRCLHA